MITRITGGKGIEMAVKAAKKQGFKLKIAGGASGYSDTYKWLLKNANGDVEYLGYVTDQRQAELYTEARGFLALERDVDFGMTPVEAMGYGTPVIAYNSGGFPESVIDPLTSANPMTAGREGPTGVLFNDYSVDGLIAAVKRFEKMKFKEEDCRKQAEKFSKERFKKEFLEFVEKHVVGAR